MELATRMQRLLANIADAAVIGVPLVIGVLPVVPHPVRLLALVVAPILIVVQMIMLTKQGQTFGKRIVDIRIVMKDTLENGGFVVNLVKRVFLNALLSIVPFYALVDILFIFRADRRCLHDMIADTIVVQAGPTVVQ
ncbi:MAG: RDD family protein [Elusimicrobiota bacterium]